MSDINTISKANIAPDSLTDDSDKLLQQIGIELEDKRTNSFTGWVEDIYASCLELHFSTWHDPSLGLVSSIKIEYIFKNLSPCFQSVHRYYLLHLRLVATIYKKNVKDTLFFSIFFIFV